MLSFDLSKAEPSRNFRNKMLARYDRTIKCLQGQRDEFVAFLDQCDIFRKERSAIIEGEIVPKLKSLDIKPSKPLGKFDNDGLIEELTRLIKENPEKDTEEIEIAMIRIKNRYRDIVNLSKKLEIYTRRLENYPDEGYPANIEEDYKDEIVIDLTNMKSKTKLEDTPKDDIERVTEVPEVEENLIETTVIEEIADDVIEEDIEKVIETHEASQELLESLAEILDNNPKKESIIEETELTDLDEQIFTTSETEDFVDQITSLAEELRADLDNLDETNIISFLSGTEEQEDYATFTINNNISLQDLVKHVYEENDDEFYDSELWVSVYNFSTNKEIIDEVADSLGVTVDEVVKTPGLLNKVTLRFPTELVTYEQVASEDEIRRVA